MRSRRPRRWQLLALGALVIMALPVCAVGTKPQPAPPAPSDVAAPRRAVTPEATPASTSEGAVGGGKTIVRHPDEQPEQFAVRVLPPGADTITKPLEFELAPLGKVVLVLYQLSSDDPATVSDPSVYRGLVLVPDGKPSSYRIEALPSQPEGVATEMYDVKSVFAADADGDGAAELCVLSEITEAGAGDRGRAHTDTDLFKWSGGRFKVIDQGDKRPLYNLRTAKAVRAKLKAAKFPARPPG